MALEIIDLQCPGCGEQVNTSIKICSFCERPIVITSFSVMDRMKVEELQENIKLYQKLQLENVNNDDINTSLAMCQIKLRMFAEANKNFERVIKSGTENSEVYFWNGLTFLRGERPYNNEEINIKRAIININEALLIEERGIYNLLNAYIKYDYFFAKQLNIIPNYRMELDLAKERGLTNEDVQRVEYAIGYRLPNEIKNAIL